MRHTRNRQLNRRWMNRKWKMPAIKIQDVYNDNALVSSDRLDKSFKWHSEAVSPNFWSNWRKSCVSFDFKSSHPNAVGMGTKYLPTKERN
ncbi:hypothetical protein [Bacillus mycoides]|uniref:hypothetical protein n=1 Tax=Bacillus mycoides TaxID=1405 RepID=UPI001C03208C|nr:hypothetical protein [Bacillus mycoides]QWG81972.1 hypothetical protein EXW61_00035 [Bacillus mycoides]